MLDSFPGISCAPCQLRPESRGTVHAKSTDPFAAPAIRPNFLSDPLDRETTVAGMRWARRNMHPPALEPYRGEQLRPGQDLKTEDKLIDHAPRTGTTGDHPNGTQQEDAGPPP